MSKSSGIVLNCKNLGDLYDDSRNHHTITNHNAIQVRGMHGRGMDFNGTTAYLDCGNHSSLNITDAITIEGWVNFVHGGASAGHYGSIIEKDWNNPVWLAIGEDSSSMAFYVNGIENKVLGGVITLNSWQYLTGTYNKDGGVNNFNMYLNGANIYSSTKTGSMTVLTGNWLIGGSAGNILNGTIDSVTIYNYALSADEIKLHYRQQSPYYQEEAPTICL